MLATSLLLLAPAPPTPAPAPQGRLFLLGRQGKIYEVHYDDPLGGMTELVAYAGAPVFPSGLEIDRTTGEFLVLIPDWPVPDGNSDILRVDPITGSINSQHTVPGDLYGFEQGADGEFFSNSLFGALVRLDLTNDTAEVLSYETSAPENFPIFFSGLAMRQDGLLEGARESRWTVDPVSGGATLSDWELDPTSFPYALGPPCYEVGADGSRYLVTPNNGMVVVDPDLNHAQLRDDLVPAGYFFGLCFDESTHDEGLETVCEGQTNSTGNAATLGVLGTPEIGANALELYSRHLPTGSFGYFVTGPNAGSVPVGSGTLCIGTPFYRYSLFPLNSGTDGTVRFDIDLFALPSGGMPTVGRTELFQYWYRDEGSTSNLSDALSITMR